MKFVAKQVDDDVNISKQSPIKDFLTLSLFLIACVMTLVITLALLSDYLVKYIPFELEKKLFSNSANIFIQKDTSPLSPEVEVYLNKVLKNLQSQLNNQNQYTIALSNSNEANAFAVPGGQIVITKELLNNIESENGLAMVIAHELAHHHYQHPLRSLGRTIVIGLALTTMLGLEKSSIQTLITSSVELNLLKFSRDQETQADKLAKQLLIKTYGHSAGADEFFQNMKQNSSNSIPQFLLTHPHTEARINRLNNQDSKGKKTKLPEIVLRYLE